ncbi:MULTISPECIES: VOC family protein [unclassified Rhizobium]|uniref:VOC family protein n=1 Tax=Rhizobium TaxID=379 RepID=UPI00084C460B|nr:MULTISPECIES: VOC family protein [unclassified Rhizobium]OEC95095.1 lactoylglutathione lyase [Rhizobium sp. YK2]QYA16036.1 VOC family protein [Rhizobium sp. AB2/73]UEQ84579.1 VOC family protein [Rhizobium sp. AB2/73]
MKNVKAIGHIAVSVKNIERSMDFYVNKLGFEEMFRLERDGRLWIVYLRITDTQFIELFPDGVGDSAPPFANVGYNHLCLEVDDIDAAIAEITARGVTLTAEKKLGVDQNYQAWIADPEGNRIELMQLGANAMQTAAIRRINGQA